MPRSKYRHGGDLLIAGATTALVFTAAAAGQVDPQLAETWFAETRELCEREGGRMWGTTLCGRMPSR